MSAYRDKARGRFIFEFDRVIAGQRVRARKLLPKTWTQAQADAYDRKESARLYAIASGVQQPEHLIEDAVAVYLRDRVPELKSGRNIERELAQMYWAYKGKTLSNLADACANYRKQSADLSPATIRNRLRYLTSACRYGWKHHKMCAHDPAEAVVMPTVNNERQVYIDRAQMLTIARACKCRSTRAAIRIAFYSGMRKGEIMRAVRTDTEFLLADTKNGEPRHIPIHPKIKCCALVPMREAERMGKAFRAARKKVGMDWLRFHDLRHSAASAMINAEVDLYTVGAVLGHKSAASTKRYAHLATKSLVEALAKIGRNEKRTKAA